MQGFEELFNRALNSYENNNFTDALSSITEAEALFDPKSEYATKLDLEDIAVLKGTIFLSLRNYEDARDSFETALELNPNSAQACLGLSEIFYREGEKKKAKTMIEWAVENDNTDKTALEALNKINVELGLPATDNQVRGEKSGGFEGYLNSAYSLFNEKRFLEALADINKAEELLRFDTAIENKSDSLASLYNFKGFNYLALDDNENARTAFERALKINPNSSQACAGLGEVFFLTGKDEESKVMYEWAIENNPENQIAAAGLAKVNKNMGLPSGHNTLNAGLSTKTQNDFYKYIAEAYDRFSEKNYPESLSKLDAAEKAFGNKYFQSTQTIVGVENMRGFNYLGLGKLDEARACFEKALNINKNSSQACAGLGEVLFLSKQDTVSKTMFEWSIKNNPDNQFARSGLSKVNRALNLPEDDYTLEKK